jgi:hypothetical protein
MQAREVAKANERSPSDQIEYWVCLGKSAEDHSEFTGQMLLDALNAESLKPNRH